MASKTKTKAEALALHYLETRSNPTKSSPSLIAQMEHRIQLVEFWGIKAGDRVLEIGCGQGDATVVLADAVGDEGSVVAIDPGAADYGSPHNLAASQAHISASPLGKRITFHTPCSPLSHLASLPASTTIPRYTHAILSHCIFYFASPSVLPALIRALAPHIEKICIAEWSLTSSSLASVPHVLTALLWSGLESKREVESMGNIRTVLSPKQITRVVLGNSSLRMESEGTFPTNKGMLDSFWEVGDVLRSSEKELEMLRTNGVDEREITVLEASFGAVESAVGRVEGGVNGVRCMDFWVGVFGRV